MRCKFKGWMDKGEHYDVQIKRGWKRERYGIMMDKCGHYVEMKDWMQKGAI